MKISQIIANQTLKLRLTKTTLTLRLKKTLSDYITEITADKMLDQFSADDLFDLMFTASYAFEQDFTFDFEDYDEMQAFIGHQPRPA